ncbi:MAG: T9SS type A sorting domain-containing protein, partial [Bacteroidetes bacterium]|nr:T9SS type A sorting domain-containing protein [Bacteroidota bacterium]
MTTFVYDSIAGNIKAYLNGTLINTIAQTSANISGTGPFKVGGYSSSTNLFAGGLLDEFRLYKYALTATEIAQLYNPYASVGFLGLDKSICPGDSVQLSLNWPVDSVVWSTGDTVENIWAKNIATYIVGITGACGVGADTITLNTLVTTNTISAANCDTYMSPSGKVFTVSGMYTDTLSNNAGCDSLLTINLSIKNSTSAVLSPTVCYSYTSPSTNYTWTVSGAYMDTIANSMGCDSMLTINLIVNTVNSAVTQAGIFLSASTAGATYKWLDCNNNYTPIANATSQSYTATANGSYAVEITNLGCADTSACYPITGVSVIESTFDKVVSVYPNPSNGTFIIDLGENQDNVTVIITDAMGRVVLSNNFGHISKIPLVLNESAGIYFVQIYSGSKRALATLAIE